MISMNNKTTLMFIHMYERKKEEPVIKCTNDGKEINLTIGGEILFRPTTISYTKSENSDDKLLMFSVQQVVDVQLLERIIMILNDTFHAFSVTLISLDDTSVYNVTADNPGIVQVFAGHEFKTVSLSELI